MIEKNCATVEKSPGTSIIKDLLYIQVGQTFYLTMVSAVQIVGGCGVFSSKCINLKVSIKSIFHKASVIITTVSQ